MPESGGADAFATKWKIKQLRGTAFTLLASEASEKASWWEDTLGEKPEEESSRPREATMRQWSMVDDQRLTLQSQPDRADWLLEHPPESEGAISPSTSEWFWGTVRKWLASSPPVQRLAMGAILHRPVPDHVSGYADLADFLSTVTIDAEHSSDFSYQINRPRESLHKPDVRINRISKWSVTRFETITGSIAVDIGSPTKATVGSLSLQGSPGVQHHSRT